MCDTHKVQANSLILGDLSRTASVLLCRSGVTLHKPITAYCQHSSHFLIH